jgi:hypothetical protein
MLTPQDPRCWTRRARVESQTISHACQSAVLTAQFGSTPTPHLVNPSACNGAFTHTRYLFLQESPQNEHTYIFQLFSYTNMCTCIYIIKSLEHFVHLMAPTCFDTACHHQGAPLSWLKSLVKNMRS